MTVNTRNESQHESPPDNPESEPDQSVDEQFRSLMEGLRTTLPGVQVLFAFLLTLPLQTEFKSIAAGERMVYYGAFASAALATVLLIAPSVHQRLRGARSGIPRRHASHVRVAVHIANVGTAISVVALTASAYLVSSLVFGDIVASVFSASVALLAAITWFYLPLVHWAHED